MRYRLALLVLSVSLVSCDLPKADSAFDEVTSGLSKIDKPLHEAYTLSLSQCPDQACTDKVESIWKPIIEVMTRIHEVWCAAVPSAEGCEEPPPAAPAKEGGSK